MRHCNSRNACPLHALSLAARWSEPISQAAGGRRSTQPPQDLWHHAQGFVHGQLQQRADAMLAVLERASFAAREQRARKTATGRTFVEMQARSE